MSTSARVDWTRGALYGVASAALFGLSAPLSKRLLPDIGPMLIQDVLSRYRFSPASKHEFEVFARHIPTTPL